MADAQVKARLDGNSATVSGSPVLVAGIRDLLAAAGWEIVLDEDCPHVSPIDESHRPVGQVDLFNVAAEQGTGDPCPFDVDGSVGVGQVEPLAVDDQVHPSTVAQTFGESQQ